MRIVGVVATAVQEVIPSDSAFSTGGRNTFDGSGLVFG